MTACGRPLLLPLPACHQGVYARLRRAMERVGVRGPFHRLRLAERPPPPPPPLPPPPTGGGGGGGGPIPAEGGGGAVATPPRPLPTLPRKRGRVRVGATSPRKRGEVKPCFRRSPPYNGVE